MRLECRHVQQTGHAVHTRNHLVCHVSKVRAHFGALGNEDHLLTLHVKIYVEETAFLGRVLQVLVEHVRLLHHEEQQALNHHVVCQLDKLSQHGHLLAR